MTQITVLSGVPTRFHGTNTLLQNKGPGTLYVGPGVTNSSSGIAVGVNEYFHLEGVSSMDMVAIGGNCDVRLQVAATAAEAGDFTIGGALNHDGTTVGFYGHAPVSRPAAYTQTFSTTSRTHAAYTSDPESSAYTGSPVDAAATAKLADLNALRVAYENLRVHHESTSKVLNQILDDLQAQGLLQ